MIEITRADISEQKLESLPNIYQQLLVNRMLMDKEFTLFLDKTPLREENTNTEAWSLYKAKLAKYEKLSQLITIAEYFMKKHGLYRPTPI